MSSISNRIHDIILDNINTLNNRNIILDLKLSIKYSKYYNYYFDYNENMKNITYNPMTPQEDVSNIYSWRVISMFSLLENGESVTVCISQDPTLAMYARKKNAV